MGALIKDEAMLNHSFNYWTVLEKVPKQKGQRQKWLCKCICGKIKAVEGTTLRTGSSKSCGCVSSKEKIIDLKGMKFGMLTALEMTNERRDNSVVWRCKCDCGKETLVSSHSLRKGSTKSCGCQIGVNLLDTKIDLKGQRFGKLLVLEETSERKDRSIVWECLCDCGNKCKVSSKQLRAGKTNSCGCIKRSLGEEKINNLLSVNNIIFETEKKFNTLGNYRFDFWVNNEYLIEFDGKQHFFIDANASGWYTEETVKKTQERDLVKNQWCKENNIPLIRIPYTQLKDLCIKDLKLETTKYRVV